MVGRESLSFLRTLPIFKTFGKLSFRDPGILLPNHNNLPKFLPRLDYITHTIYVIFTYIYQENPPNVGI